MGRTPRGQTRAKVFDFVRQRLLVGQPPTVREVQHAFGFKAVETARVHLDALVSEGLLSKAVGKARGYRLASGQHSTPPLMVPLLGRVQAGSLTTAVEEAEGFVPVQHRAHSQDLFALRVRGDSMRDAGILPGDIVIVRRQASADPGDIVVALVGDEATVKRLLLGPDYVELRPANAAYAPLRFAPDELSLLGKVVELHRDFEPVPLSTGNAAL